MAFPNLIEIFSNHIYSFGPDDKYKVRTLYGAIGVMTALTTIFLFLNQIPGGKNFFFSEELAIYLFLAVTALLLIKFHNLKSAAAALLVSYIALLAIQLRLRGMFDAFIISLLFAFPIIALYFKGKTKGLIWCIGTFSFFAVLLLLNSSGMLKIPAFTWESIRPLAVGFGTISILGYLFELEKERSRKALLHQYYTHPLTSIPNRNQLILDLKSSAKWLILANLDDFKEINDFFGSKTGDAVLTETAKRLSAIRDKDRRYKLFHLHGDEFALMTNFTLVETEVSETANRVYQSITKEAYRINEQEINLNITIGISHDSVNILANADIALKQAKKKRKSHLFYENNIKVTTEYEQNLKWSVLLKEAIIDDRIIPYFQPIVNAQTGKIEKYECLARLINANGKAVPPKFFLEIAKKTKMYHYITRKILTKSFDEFRYKSYEFAINISLEDIQDMETVAFILDNLKKYEIGDRVVFEILESEGIENYDEVLSFIELVKKYGCKIAIDDFGTGYSNFEHISRLNVDYLKIDGSLIKKIDIEKRHQVLVKNIIDFSRELNIKTISEFVHSEDVHKWVKYLNVDFEQGYFWGEPHHTSK